APPPTPSTPPTPAPPPTCSHAPATAGVTDYLVLIDLPNGCGAVAGPYRANTFNEAKSCARSEGFNVPVQMCKYTVQIDQNWTTEIPASSSANAMACAINRECASCSPTVVNTLGCVPQ